MEVCGWVERCRSGSVAVWKCNGPTPLNKHHPTTFPNRYPPPNGQGRPAARSAPCRPPPAQRRTAMRSVLLAAVFVAAGAVPGAAQYDDATRALIDAEIAEACEGHPGIIEPFAVTVRDLTGDGDDDLIISHEGIACDAAAPMGRSLFCGASLCSIAFFVRRDGRLDHVTTILGAGLEVDDDDPPGIRTATAGMGSAVVRWDGETFR